MHFFETFRLAQILPTIITEYKYSRTENWFEYLQDTITGAGKSMPTAALGMVMGIESYQWTIREAPIKALPRINNSNTKKVLRVFNSPYTGDGWVALRISTK